LREAARSFLPFSIASTIDPARLIRFMEDLVQSENKFEILPRAFQISVTSRISIDDAAGRRCDQ